jgi:hypothetical protein
MPDIEGIIKITNLLLQRIFGKNVPAWIPPLINWILLGVLLLCGLWGLLVLLSKIKEVWIQSFLPLFYKPEQKRRQHRRRMFAKHLEYEISRLDLLEDWKDEHFAELEAEVEADGRRKRFILFPFNQPKSGLRREKSLSKALANSQERFILVEGEPGSGKSVALRHVAQHMAARAKKSRSMKSVIPIYVNLKELERPDDGVIDRNLIESFILKSLKRINDRDIDTFLDEEFSEGIANGTWFFLLDSFDELPEVLSSTEADTIIKSYSDAIADFLQGGMNQCRGVIASRQFRGPKHFSWYRFRILALSESRRRELVRKADLPLALERDLIGYIGTANQEIRSMTCNPLFLSLLCEHMKSGHPFPENTHAVFETYIEHRLNRDKERILQRFNIDIQQIRTATESIAFCMVGNTGLGLSPTRANLHSAMADQDLDVDASFDTLLDALEYIKLARSEVATQIGESRSFTFAHRRFQEYFATCVVLRDPGRVSPKQLLMDGRWRETAVVMCQTQPVQALTPLMHYAEQLLTHFCQNISSLIDNPLAYLNSRDQDASIQQGQNLQHFPWPAGALHLLALLQEGFTSRLDVLPDAIKLYVGKLGLSATETGALDDRKWALEVCGIAPEPILIYMLKKAFAEKSQWLKEVAYRQVAHIHSIPEQIAQGIHEAIVNQALNGRLHHERYATQTHLARLPQPITSNLLSSMKLLLLLYPIELGWHIISFILTIIYLLPLSSWSWLYILIACSIISVSYRYTFIFGNKHIYTIKDVKYLLIKKLELFIATVAFILYYALFIQKLKSISIYMSILLVILFTSVFLLDIYVYQAAKKGYLTQWVFGAFIPCWPTIWFLLYAYKSALSYINSLNFGSIWKKTREFFLITLFVISVICIILFLAVFLTVIFPYTVIIIGCVSFIFTLIGGGIRFNFIKAKVVLKDAFVLFIVIIAMSNIKAFLPANLSNTVIRIIMFMLGIIPIGIVIGPGVIKAINFFAFITKKFIAKEKLLVTDRLRWRAWSRDSQKPMTCDELYAVINTFCSRSSHIRVIKYIREHHLLTATKETEASLKKLALEVEVFLQNKQELTSECPILVEQADYDTLDEISLILENVRSSLYGNMASV